MNVLLLSVASIALQSDARLDERRYERTMDQTYEIARGASLDVAHTMGSVEVTTWKRDQVHVVARIHAEGEHAQEIGSDIEVQVEPSGRPFRIRTRYSKRSRPGTSFGVDLSIQLPEGHPVKVDDSFGSVSITGITEDVEARVSNGDLSVLEVRGELDLQGSFGDLEVVSCAGRARVRGTNGGIQVKGLKGDGLELENHFGPVEILDNEGELRLSVANGEVTVRETGGPVEARLTFSKAILEQIHGDLEFQGQNVRARLRDIAGEARLENTFGQLEIEGVEKDARIVTGNSPLTVHRVKGKLEVRNTFGPVEVESIGAACRLTNGNGKVYLRDIGGRVDLDSSFGAIEIRDVKGDVVARTNNGRVHVEGVRTRHDGRIDLQGAFGEVTLSLPDPPSAELDLSATFGRIKSEYELENIERSLSSESCKETLGEGALRVRVKNQNGDVRILRGAREKRGEVD